MSKTNYISKHLSIEEIFGWRVHWVICHLEFEVDKLTHTKTDESIQIRETLIDKAHADIEIILHECGIMAGFDIEYETRHELEKTQPYAKFNQCIIEQAIAVKKLREMKNKDDVEKIDKIIQMATNNLEEQVLQPV